MRVRGRCFSAEGSCFFHKEGSRFSSVVSLLGFGIPPCSEELSPLSCEAVLLEMCVVGRSCLECLAFPQGWVRR